MPLYDYKCQRCEQQFEAMQPWRGRKYAICKCGGIGRKLVTSQAAKYHAFPAGVWEHLDVEPVQINSKRQLKEECEKRGLGSVYLQDS